jgi:hypothetical protein
MNRLTVFTLATSFLALAPALTAACLTGSVTCFVPRTPHGIYATVGIAQYENDYLLAHRSASSVPPDYFSGTVYPDLLANPDVSGITLYVRWSRLNPNPAPSPITPPGHFQYDWSLVQDLLDQAGAVKKTVQLVVTPGINSPTWLLGDINGKNDGLLKSCNYLFDTTYKPPPTGTECGKVTFWGFDEGGWDQKNMTPRAHQEVPMPWNSTYKNAWQTFLTALAAQVGGNPSLVSIAVAGPTASSEEMILPTSQNTYGGKKGPYNGNGGPQLGGYTAEQMWDKLLAHHYTSAYQDYTKYQKTDVAFIDEWEHAIDVFGKTFSGLTLTVSTGDGLPNLTACNLNKETCPFAIPTSPIDFSSVCIVADMDCAAETTILAYFIQSTVGGPNAKATQTDGMAGGAKHGNLSVPNVKLISESTDLYTSPSQRILGGAQFNSRFSTDKSDEGNTVEGGCGTGGCSAEQAEYNVLTWFFDGTNQGPSFPTGSVPKVGGNPGTAPLNYLQIYGLDITYATTDAFGKQLVMMGGSMNPMSAQDLLHKASLALALIGEY